MAEVFDDETEQTISIQEYLKEVEEQELVILSFPLWIRVSDYWLAFQNFSDTMAC